MPHSNITDKYDPYVAIAIMILTLAVALTDMCLFVRYGQEYTISAYLRRVMFSYPSVLAVVSFALGALFSHILFVR